MRHKIVAGNWKMHGSRAENTALIEAIIAQVTDDRVSCIVCPPYVYLQDAWRLQAPKSLVKRFDGAD